MSSVDSVVVGTTKSGKDIAYKVPAGKNLYEIFFTTGGQVPTSLKGSWNDIRQIRAVVSNYLASEKPVTKVTTKTPMSKKVK